MPSDGIGRQPAVIARRRRGQVGGRRGRVDPVEHLLVGRPSGGERREVRRARSRPDVRGADRRGDADDGERPRRRGAARTGPETGSPPWPVASDRGLHGRRPCPPTCLPSTRAVVLVEDDLAGRLPPAPGSDRDPVDRARPASGRPETTGAGITPCRRRLPRHARATGHGTGARVTPLAALVVAASCGGGRRRPS